jgi:hypothetical protein
MVGTPEGEETPSMATLGFIGSIATKLARLAIAAGIPQEPRS